MLTLTVFSGLPGAGKSTAAHAAQRRNGAVLVARDAIRDALTGLTDEWTLTLALAALARALLQRGESVIVDAPNLAPVDRPLLAGLAAETGAALAWRHIDTPLAECIARDAQRPNGIGADAIRSHAA